MVEVVSLFICVLCLHHTAVDRLQNLILFRFIHTHALQSLSCSAVRADKSVVVDSGECRMSHEALSASLADMNVLAFRFHDLHSSKLS